MQQIVLTKEDIYRQAPSIFTEDKGSKLTKRFNHVQTEQVIDVMHTLNWVPIKVKQAKVLDDKSWRNGHQRHMIVFQPNVGDFAFKTNEEIPQMYYINSSDGMISQRFQAGLFRLICENGLVIGKHTFGEIRLLHRSYSPNESIDIIGTYIESALSKMSSIDAYKEIDLSHSQRLDFAKTALVQRFGKQSTYSITDVLRPRREEDKGSSLWKTFNVIQENLVKGGLTKTIDSDTKSGSRQVTSKEITNIDREINFNMALWGLMDQIAKQHF